MEEHQLNASSLADKIGVQRSSLSHILSKRNKPSLDFILKINKNFKKIDLNWLLFGKSSLENIKENDKKDFVILDAAMNDLMRPALYGANHKTLPSIKRNQISKKTYEFVGPICESTDKFTSLTKFQKLEEKDIIVMCDVGAYGMSLSSNYNLRPKPVELFIKGSKIRVIKKRQKHTDLM